jgi:hypothetical protein
VAPCSLVDVYPLLEVPAASIVRAVVEVLMMEAANISVNFYQTTRCNPEDSHLLD